MLTKKLLETRRRKPTIEPIYREPAEYRRLAERVLDAYEPGRRRGDVDADLRALETHGTYKLVRSLAKLLDRDAEFERRAPADPAALRAAVFERGYVTSEAERRRALAAVGDAFGVPPAAVEAGMRADRPEEEVLIAAERPTPEALLRRYNLALIQTLLYDAREIRIRIGADGDDLLRRLAGTGVMYRLDDADRSSRTVRARIVGPAGVSKRSRAYRRRVADLLAAVVGAGEWRIEADVDVEVAGETIPYEFALDSDRADLVPREPPAVAAEPDHVAFAERLAAAADGWRVAVGPTPLRGPDGALAAPAVLVERRTSGRRCFVDFAGFWTPEYLAERLARLRAAAADAAALLLVDDAGRCAEGSIPAEGAGEGVMRYSGTPPVDAAVEWLHGVEKRAIASDAAMLARQGLGVDGEAPTDIDALAAEYWIEPTAVEEHLRETRSGVVSNGTFLPEPVAERIRRDIDDLSEPTLAEVNPILAAYGVGQDALSALGYAVSYGTLDQTEVEVRKAT
ncbi:DUF790 family protein [Halegenticoccus soli]|uniref:DUF790 family protein n=1 Tax=Halegenticoccus soli TaxID=1985678 RepID=UPI000C6DDFDA|nr:DUF790 family protein [Halegenticoccus soli]